MDRNGKKPKATQKDPLHAERSDTKARHRDEAEGSDAEVRAKAQQAEADERLALKNASQKGPQQL
jgi:hypothetical protein